MKRAALALLGLLLFGSEPVFAHGGTHPTPGPLPPSGTPTPTPVPVPTPPTPNPTAPPCPAYIVVPPNSSTGNFVVYWAPTSGTTGFELEEDVVPTFANQWRYTLGAGVTAVSISNRANGTWYYRVRGVNSGLAGPWCTGSNGCVVFLQGTLRLSVGSASSASLWKLPGTQGVAVLQLNLAADSVESITVQSLAFHAAGSFVDPVDVTAATLYADVNGNGSLESGTDVLLAGPLAFGTDDGTVQFQSLARTITNGTRELWMLVLDLAPGVAPGSVFQATIRTAADLTALGNRTGGPPIVLGLPVTGSQLMVSPTPNSPPPVTLGSLTLGTGPSNPANGTVARGTDGNVLLHISLTGGPGEPLVLDILTLAFFGTLPEPSGLLHFSLVEDTNGNGALDRDDRKIRGPVPILPGDPKIVFLGLGERIPSGVSVVWFVTADVGRGVEIGETLGVNLDAPHFVAAK
ncbi:MAG: hypothetical protein MUC63_04085, partial [Planctomycetes bacterium]|nr:hypothetical protein [Planctomycetota bacterium]